MFANQSFCAAIHKPGLGRVSILALTLAGMTTAASAQDAGQGAGAAAVAAPDADIIVTATRRAETLYDVPIAVSAVSGNNIKSLGLNDTFSVVSQVPNMAVDQGVGAHAVPQFNLRGVGTNDVYVTAVSAVGVYYDDVFVNNVFGQGIPLFDQERVEILRGPQGTLWGKNTTTGAVNMISQKPGKEFNAYARAGYGNYNAAEFEGAVGGPIAGDKLAARVAVFAASRSGMYYNVTRDEKVNDYNDVAVRAQLAWTPTPEFTARFIGTIRREHEQGYYTSFGLGPNGETATGYINDSRNGNIEADEDSPISIDTDVAIADLRYEPGNGIGFASISGYIRNKFRSRFDVDGTSVPFFIGRQDVDAKQYTQELRAYSDNHSPFSWMIGLFYLREDLNGSNPNAFPTIPSFNTVRLLDQRTSSAAAFANAEYAITGALKLRGGIRYTKERKRIDLLGAGFTPGTSDLLNVAQFTALFPFVDVHGARRNDGEITWDAALQYDVTPGTMVFGRIAKGFKSSIFNASVYGPGDFSAADPETIIDYEVGIKSSLLNNTLQANLTGFYYDYSNYQIQQTAATSVGFSSVYGNAPKARIYGAEVELTFRPNRDLLFNLSAGYTSAEFRNFTNASLPAEINSGLPFNASGQRLPRAPRGTGSFLAQYTIRGSSGDLTLQTNWNYVGRTDYEIWVNTPTSQLNVSPAFLPYIENAREGLVSPARVIGNARISYAFGDDRRAEVALWVKNLTDKYYITSRFSFYSLNQYGAKLGDPRTYGVTLGYKF